MKIKHLQENLTPASAPSEKTIPPKFGRSDEMLESDCGTTGAGSVASVSSPVGGMQRRGQGSMFQGIKTSAKYPNSAAVKEGDSFGSFAGLKGWQEWNVMVFNNFYRGKYADYGPRLYSVVAGSPEEARQVVLANPDFVLKDLLSRKLQSGKRVLPRGSALPIEDKRVGGVDKIKPGSLTTMGFKEMLTPKGPMKLKFSGGKIVASEDQPEEQLDEIFNPTSSIAHFLRAASSFAGDYIPVAIGAAGTFAATTAVLGPVAAMMASSTVGSQILQTIQNQQNKVPGIIQQMVEKYFGSEQEEVEFALIHAKAAFEGKQKFRWRGQEWTVTLERNAAEAIIEKNDRYWLEQYQRQQQQPQVGMAEAKKAANTKTFRAGLSKRVKAQPSEKEQEKKQADSDAAWERLMAYAAAQKDEKVKEARVGTTGFRVTWNEAGQKCTTGLLLKPGAIEIAKKLQKKQGASDVKVVPYNSVNEMDGDGSGRDGSNRKRIGSYGQRDREMSGPDIHLGKEHVMKTKDVLKRGEEALNKAFSDKEVKENVDPETARLEQDVRDALENGDDYTAKQYAKMAPTPEAKKYLLNIIKQEMFRDDDLDEGVWGDTAKLVGIPAVAGALAVGANHLDQQQPHVDIGGQSAKIVNYGPSQIPDYAMTLQGKDGKTYRVWTTRGSGGGHATLAVPTKEVKEAFIAPALSAANSNAEFERQRTFGTPGGGYKGRVKLDVEGKDDYINVKNALTQAAKKIGHHVECGLSGNQMSVFSDSMNSDELDNFIDNILPQMMEENTESDRIQALYDKLERFEERLGSDDPRVQAIKDEIRGLRDEYRVVGQNTANSLRGVTENSMADFFAKAAQEKFPNALVRKNGETIQEPPKREVPPPAPQAPVDVEKLKVVLANLEKKYEQLGGDSWQYADRMMDRDYEAQAVGREINRLKSQIAKAGEQLDEKSKSKAQFRTMAAVAHNPKFAKKVGIKQSVGKEFHKADKGVNYKSLPAKVDEAEIAEDMLAHDLYKDFQIFKKGADKDIGGKAKNKDLSGKPKDKEIINKVTKMANEDKDPCWKGYKQIGMKDKSGKKVPNCVPVKEEEVSEDWQKVNKSDKTDGMSPKAVKAYRRENPGSKLKTAVTTKPSKLKAGSKDAKRRKSFCARMSGVEGPMKDEHGKPTAKAKALKRWNC